MNAFPTERDIRLTVQLLIEQYGVDKNFLAKFIGNENYEDLTYMLLNLEEGEMDVYKLARLIVINKGPYLFAGSNSVVRELRAILLRQLGDKELIELYDRNQISGKNIKSPSYMPNALASKKWTMGGKWARDFTQALGFPLVFSGISIPKDQSAVPFQDIEPKKSLPPLVEYQLEVKNKMLRVLNEEEDKARCVVTLPTGGGKTRVAVESFIEWMQPRFSEGKYLLWIAQGEELCEQAISCITDMWQDKEFTEALRIYRYFGGKKIQEENLVGGAVIASIQQLYTRIKNKDPIIEEILKHCGAVIIDEAHHATANSYKLVFDKARELVGEKLFPICGLTATPGRSNDETVDLVNQFEAYLIHPTIPKKEEYENNPMLYFREEGFLAEPIFLLHEQGEEVEVADYMIDEETGDLNSEFLRVLAENQERNFHIIEYMMSLSQGSSALVYACTVDHAEFLAMVMNSVGRKSAVITAETPKQIRKIHIEAFKKGEIEFLFNYGVLTTGFDAPKTDHILICRPTSSIILYEQMVGRGLRGAKFGGTKHCYIVDFSQNMKRHGKPLAYARFINEWQVKAINEMDGVMV
ncbi:DEAD/DEAH box helicase [Evansella clarkii]|uniref:DEAD/DEAH box helicase n=1 Tax=Evansella clarkii TaxID=79879 RepID=UPI0009976296|nr:DEAD/DEAH box helicase [Evansella clarkii]